MWTEKRKVGYFLEGFQPECAYNCMGTLLSGLTFSIWKQYLHNQILVKSKINIFHLEWSEAELQKMENLSGWKGAFFKNH